MHEPSHGPSMSHSATCNGRVPPSIFFIVTEIEVAISTLTKYGVASHTTAIACCDQRIYTPYNSRLNVG